MSRRMMSCTVVAACAANRPVLLLLRQALEDLTCHVKGQAAAIMRKVRRAWLWHINDWATSFAGVFLALVGRLQHQHADETGCM